MGAFLDTVPVSAIIKIRDLMHTVKDPFRLDQGDVSFDAPDSVKQAMANAITDNRDALSADDRCAAPEAVAGRKMRSKNGIPIGSDDEVVPTNGGTHAIWAMLHALFEPGDEMIVADPEWPPTMAIAIAAGAVLWRCRSTSHLAGAGRSTRSSARLRRAPRRSTSTRRTIPPAAC